MITNDQKTEENSDQPLTAKQEGLIALLLAGVKTPAAAKQIHISEVTARRWLKLAHVQHAYREAQQDVFEEALNELRTGVSLAIKTLKRHMEDPDTRPYVQVAASSKWLDLALELYKLSEVEQRIAELEQSLKDRL